MKLTTLRFVARGWGWAGMAVRFYRLAVKIYREDLISGEVSTY